MKKLIVMSFPIKNDVLMVSMERKTQFEKIAFKILKLVEKLLIQYQDFFSKVLMLILDLPFHVFLCMTFPTKKLIVSRFCLASSAAFPSSLKTCTIISDNVGLV